MSFVRPKDLVLSAWSSGRCSGWQAPDLSRVAYAASHPAVLRAGLAAVPRRRPAEPAARPAARSRSGWCCRPTAAPSSPACCCGRRTRRRRPADRLRRQRPGRRDPGAAARPDFPDLHVAVFHYRGYGPSTGRPSEAALLADALAIHDDLRARLQPQRIYAIGISLGSAVAACLSQQRALAGVLLITPFDSIEAIAKESYFWVPVGLLLRHRFPTIEFMAGNATPVAVIAAEQDRVVRPGAHAGPARAAAEPGLRARARRRRPQHALPAAGLRRGAQGGLRGAARRRHEQLIGNAAAICRWVRTGVWWSVSNIRRKPWQ